MDCNSSAASLSSIFGLSVGDACQATLVFWLERLHFSQQSIAIHKGSLQAGARVRGTANGKACSLHGRGVVRDPARCMAAGGNIWG